MKLSGWQLLGWVMGLFTLGTIIVLGCFGKWEALFFVFTSAIAVKIILGVVQLALLPVNYLALRFERSGSRVAMIFCFGLSLLVEKIAFAAVCLTILAYFNEVSGPPKFVTLYLAFMCSVVPFLWAAQIRNVRINPCAFDLLASSVGTFLAGLTLYITGNILWAALPLVLCFLASGCIFLFAVWGLGLEKLLFQSEVQQ